MNGYLDSLKQELVSASGRLPMIAGVNRRPRWRRRSRLMGVAIAVLALSATAVAATAPWRPIFGDPSSPQPVVVSRAAPPAEQLALLGVLRRAQTENDRGSTTQRALRFFGTSTQGVHTDYIRVLATGDGELPAVLVPARSWNLVGVEENEPRLRKVFDRARKQDALCIFVFDPVDGGGNGCYTTAELLKGFAGGGIGPVAYGLVPDGVARVRFEYQTGAETATVRDNFYEHRTAEPGATHVPLPNKTTWLDVDGKPTTEQPEPTPDQPG